MPEVCRFYGIVISIYYNDHGPPHFHARPANNLVSLSSGDLVWVRTTGTVTADILGEPVTLSCTGEGDADENCWNQIAIS